jgi:hypothetical protein
LILSASIAPNCKVGTTKIKRCSSNVAFGNQLDNAKNLKKTIIIGGLALIPFASLPAGLLLCIGKSKKLAATKLSKALNESESYQIMRDATEKTIQKGLELTKKIANSELAQTMVAKSKEAINKSETYEIVRDEAVKTVKSGIELKNEIINSKFAQTILTMSKDINKSETYEIVRNEAEKTIKKGLELTNKITNSELAQTIATKFTKLFD